MRATLTSSSRQITLPKFGRNGLSEIIQANVAKSRTLDGTLAVDLFNNVGGWRMKFDAITAAEYTEIRQIYNDQFDNVEFLVANLTGLSGDNVNVWLSMPPERGINWDQQAVVGLEITLEKASAD